MALYSISDLHLPLGVDKPMDVFGSAWENYVERLEKNWQSIVGEDDLIILPGDFSWATYIEQTKKDFEFLSRLNGRKILLKGNHDYWWTTMNKLKNFISENAFGGIEFIQNNAFEYENISICGTRGWKHPAWENFSEEDRKIFDREVLRLELSLKQAKNEEIYVFTHYPPMSDSLEENEFVNIMKKYGVTKCIYGHLHAASHSRAVTGNIDGIEYILVSADYLKFRPRLIK